MVFCFCSEEETIVVCLSPEGGGGVSPIAQGGGGASATPLERTKMKTGKEASCPGVSTHVTWKVKVVL